MQNVARRMSYKPGWSFTVYEGEWEGPHVAIKVEGLPNTYQDEPIDICVHSMVPPMEHPGQFTRWLAWRIGRIELHEMREFLKLDGKILYDPHAPFANEDRSSDTIEV